MMKPIYLRRVMAVLFALSCVGMSACKKGLSVGDATDGEKAKPVMSTKEALAKQTSKDPTDSGAPLAPGEVETQEGDGDLVGRVSRDMIEDQRNDWKDLIAQAKPDTDASQALARVAPGAEVVIYFGAWCSDCERELPRFFKAIDLAQQGIAKEGIAKEMPFTYELIGVDKYFQADEVSATPLDIPAVPLFIVKRDGQEVGRVVEKSPGGIEKDVLSLLDGSKTGKISATR